MAVVVCRFGSQRCIDTRKLLHDGIGPVAEMAEIVVAFMESMTKQFSERHGVAATGVVPSGYPMDAHERRQE
jgi:hypothetical protein